MLVWIDLEMTGLDLAKDALIEIAVLVTDGDLNVQDARTRPVDSAFRQAMDAMGDFVRKMHTDSGVAGRIDARNPDDGAGRTTGARLHQAVRPRAEEGAVGRQHDRHRPVVPGTRHATARRTPALPQRLQRQGTGPPLSPKAYYAAPAKHGNHRALADIQESIEELRYYREAVFRAVARSIDRIFVIAGKHEGAVTGFGEAAQAQVATRRRTAERRSPLLSSPCGAGRLRLSRSGLIGIAPAQHHGASSPHRPRPAGQPSGRRPRRRLR